MSESPSPKPESGDVDERTVGHDSTVNREDDCLGQWRRVFEEAEGGLRAFLRNRLRQESDVDDCLQVVFLKMVEAGPDVAPAARRAWLFRVAANESARMWRSEASKDRLLQQHGEDQGQSDQADTLPPIEQVILTETVAQVEQSLQRLPAAWQQVVRLRIHQNLTFQEIADRLGIPLGTALTQMRRALERLKSEIDHDKP